tara:strand:+ start:2063 stop:2542 length:480 start_codon:yes stop_codon:yes gene_type:complete
MAISREKQEVFLHHFAQTMNVSQSARKAGLKSPREVQRERESNPKFAEEWEMIEESKLDQLEAELWKDALEHKEDRRWVLSKLRKRWADKKKVEGVINHNVDIKSLSKADLLKIVGRPVEAEFTEDKPRTHLGTRGTDGTDSTAKEKIGPDGDTGTEVD